MQNKEDNVFFISKEIQESVDLNDTIEKNYSYSLKIQDQNFICEIKKIKIKNNKKHIWVKIKYFDFNDLLKGQEMLFIDNKNNKNYTVNLSDVKIKVDKNDNYIIKILLKED